MTLINIFVAGVYANEPHLGSHLPHKHLGLLTVLSSVSKLALKQWEHLSICCKLLGWGVSGLEWE